MVGFDRIHRSECSGLRRLVEHYFAVADMADTALGLVFADGKLVDLVGPGEVAFYAKALREIEVRVLDAADMLEEKYDIAVNVWSVTSYKELYMDAMENIKKAFDEAGISIPYPQQDVHIHQE